jgi:hypothetical protein|nr:MAG TPA: hypothetical protein [Bacteriophage sp.]
MTSRPTDYKRHYWAAPISHYELPEEERERLRIHVKDRLTAHCLTQVWLIQQLQNAGLTTDKSELCSILAGTRFGPKVDEILVESDRIITAYDDFLCAVDKKHSSLWTKICKKKS